MRNRIHYAAAVIVGMLAAAPLSAEAAASASHLAAPAAPVVEAQYSAPGPYYEGGRWRRCHWLRRRAEEVQYRLSSAPPWDHPRLHQRLASLRHELWETCRW